MKLLVFGDLIGNILVTYLPYSNLIKELWNLIRYIMVLIIMICIFAGIYRYTPAKRISWQEVFPGAIVSTIGWLIVSLGFSFYINNFSNYSRLYGSLGAVFVLMTWLYISSIILILGGEINSVIVIRKNNSLNNAKYITDAMYVPTASGPVTTMYLTPTIGFNAVKKYNNYGVKIVSP